MFALFCLAPLLAALGGPASSAAVIKGFTDVLDDEQGDEFIEQVRRVVHKEPFTCDVSNDLGSKVSV